ncbi:phospholipid/glycerol acyltransferase [Thermobaculum terrenum ATCC BAA-798]|uniref:Phospholipid/glycerol acyltransferase n=2 Tax=Thermobaculum TaxID=262406 RepID=D1CF98_THET1|nr:phospholipid/glycerol acyltransferase [Thermobaculum terrenum ATCC BAA-798]
MDVKHQHSTNRSPKDRLSHIIARWIIVHIITPLMVKLEVIGRENIPKEGPFIAAANHLSNLDPPLLMSQLPRVPRVMAKRELWRFPIAAAFFNWVEAIPIKREGYDRRALREAEEVLASGRPFGIFPEGTRSRTGKLQPGLPGVGMLAIRSKVPVVPIAFIGTNQVFKGRKFHPRTRIKMIIGKPISPEEIQQLGNAKAVTDYIMSRIAQMLPPDMRGVYSEEKFEKESERDLSSREEQSNV